MKLALDACETLAFGKVAGVGPGDDDDVIGDVKLRSLRLERLPKQALDSVALDGAAALPGDAQAEPRTLRLRAGFTGTRKEVKDEEATAVGAPLPVNPFEIGASGEPALRPAPTASGREIHAQVLRRLRPLSRRRLSRARPARVLIRPRKPWDRARLRFLGW